MIPTVAEVVTMKTLVMTVMKGRLTLTTVSWMPCSKTCLGPVRPDLQLRGSRQSRDLPSVQSAPTVPPVPGSLSPVEEGSTTASWEVRTPRLAPSLDMNLRLLGSDAKGAVSSVSVMDVGSYVVPATPLIAPFPSFMTKGSGNTFSTFSRDNLQTCTPGYYARTLLPASTFGPLLGHQSYIPGSCNQYDFQVQ